MGISRSEQVETDLDRLIERRDAQRRKAEGEARGGFMGGVLYRGYELQNEHLVGSYLEKYPDERP